MRKLTQLLIYLLLFSALYIWLAPTIKEIWLQSKIAQNSPEQARASSYFPLEGKKWLTFDIANQSRLFRFYFHAALMPNNEEQNLSYEIQYQWLDVNAEIIAENIYHINTRSSPYLSMHIQAEQSTEQAVDVSTANKEGDPVLTLLPSRFYNHNRSEPSLDQSLYLSPAQQPLAKQLRFRVHTMDAGIEHIGLRSYLQYQRDQKDVDIAWQRMSSAQKQDITSASVYPNFLLSVYERHNIMRAYWKPIGPLGVLDKDYRIETLYIRENTEPTLPQEPIVSDGLFVSPEHWLTVKLNHPSARYRIQWQAITPLQADIPRVMKLRWQGNDIRQERYWEENVTNAMWEGVLAEGLLQVIPDGKGIFKLYQFENDQWQDITPEKLRSRAYLCTPNTPLQYSLSSGVEVQSIKINARNFYRSDQASNNKTHKVMFSTKSDRGETLIQDTIQLDDMVNPYQQFNDAALIDSHVFESSNRYLTAQKNSQDLLIKCTGPVLISVSTRPWRHPVSQVLPRDSHYWLAYPEREPAWFSLRPYNAQQLITNKQYHSLIWYLQPIDSNPLITSGQFSWKSLENQDPYALEKSLFTHNESDTSTRMEARAVSFIELSAAQKVNFAGRNAQAQLRASAVYLRSQNTPELVTVWLDNKEVLTTTVVGKSGRFHLPDIISGEHKIEFRSKDNTIRWFINNTTQSKRSHLLRWAYPLLPQDVNNKEPAGFTQRSAAHTTLKNKQQHYSVTWQFEISGQGQQLAIWLFSPNHTAALNCELTLRSKRLIGSQSSHSFRHYQYTISSSDYPVSHILKQKKGLVHGPIPLFIALKKDLPAQQASIKLSCDQPEVLASGGIISAGENTSYDFRERIDAQ